MGILIIEINGIHIGSFNTALVDMIGFFSKHKEANPDEAIVNPNPGSGGTAKPGEGTGDATQPGTATGGSTQPGEDPEGDSDSDKPKEVYNSIKDSPNYPEGFEPVKNGTTKNTVKNGKLLDELRKIESGTWKKIYKDGYDAYGNKVSIHYFQSESGKVFDVKVKPGWSNGG